MVGPQRKGALRAALRAAHRNALLCMRIGSPAWEPRNTAGHCTTGFIKSPAIIFAYGDIAQLVRAQHS
jgi:hypothetical protein